MEGCTHLLNGYEISLSDKSTCSGQTSVCVSFNSMERMQDVNWMTHPCKHISWSIRHWHLTAQYFSWCSSWLKMALTDSEFKDMWLPNVYILIKEIRFQVSESAKPYSPLTCAVKAIQWADPSQQWSTHPGFTTSPPSPLCGIWELEEQNQVKLWVEIKTV